MRTLGSGIVLAMLAAVVVMAARLRRRRQGDWRQSHCHRLLRLQASATALKLYSSAADVQALLAKAKSERKEGQVMVAEPILSLAPYATNLEYRPVEGAVAVHEKEAEWVYVIDGGGTLTTGGSVMGEKRTNAANLSGTAIDGGTIQTIAKGEFAIIPEGTPHQFKPAGGPLVLMTMHVPRPVGAAQ